MQSPFLTARSLSWCRLLAVQVVLGVLAVLLARVALAAQEVRFVRSVPVFNQMFVGCGCSEAGLFWTGCVTERCIDRCIVLYKG